MSSFYIPPNERLHRREKVLKDAQVIYPDERGPADVLITDMSVGGANIQLKSSTDLSGDFKLYIPPEKKIYTAAVRWMKGSLVGLQFKGKSECPTIPASDAGVGLQTVKVLISSWLSRSR